MPEPIDSTEPAAEANLLQRVWQRLGSSRRTRVFRNNVGAILVAGRWIRYGLHPGSGDLIGWTTREITAADVGHYVAVFTSIEVKGRRTRITAEQRNWDRAVREAGGISGIVRSVEEAEEIVADVRSSE